MKKLFFPFVLFFCVANLFAQDATGTKDHPLFSRYPDSKIISYYENEYNELKFAIAPAQAEAQPTEWLPVKGEHTSIVFEVPLGVTTIQVMKNYKDAIQAQGGEIVFECNNGECAGTDAWYNARFFNSVYMKSNRNGGGVSHYEYFDAYHRAQRYLVAKIKTSEKIYHLEIGATPKYDENSVKICLEIVEEEAMTSGLIEINVDAIKTQLDQFGKIQVYTIFFATNSATIEEGSAATLQVIADYLAKYPQEQLYIVGHTDDTGSFTHNLKLSKSRADAVVADLEKLQPGTSSQLQSEGVGPLSPEASNESEKGKEMNRRVELIRRLK